MRWGKREDIDLGWWGLFVMLIVMVVAFVFKVIEFRTGMIILEVLK